ncbi:MAG: hypothetical protein LBP72_07100 [Dysgonamonadaceae bacterium]|jgi:hypothetical protein|nr:hypothetical protein [Dysgonamonadaceae bacterium]
MKKCAFTICAKNYIGLAKVLEQSFIKHNPNVDFYIFIADELSDEQRKLCHSNILPAKDVLACRAELWEEMSFKYDIVEFCTAIKPLCFKHVFDKGYKKALYFDPDILFYSNIEEAWQILDNYCTLVTPHLAYPYITITEKETDDHGMLSSGVYNLGFIGLKDSDSVRRLLTWWSDRLSHHCVSEIQDGFFTDQKWMDWLPWILNNGELYVSRHLGWNIAPWNLKERKVIKQDTSYHILLKRDETIVHPLVFFHYSAVNYKDLLKGIYRNRNFEMDTEDNYLIELLTIYGEHIRESDFTAYLSWPYTYNCFSNGDSIQLSHRRIYKRLTDEGICYSNVFSSEGVFYRMLKKRKLLFQSNNSPERMKADKVSNYGRKIAVFDQLSYLFVRIIGFERYTMLCRFLTHYLKKKNYVRLLGKAYRKFPV